MIQRIQTLYLLLGALALGALGLFDAPWSGVAASRFSWFVPALIALLIATASTAIGAIFLHEDQEQRKTQRKTVIGVQVLTFLLAGTLYGGSYWVGTLTFMSPDGILWGRSVVLSLPIIAYGLFFLARWAIESDIERVERMNQGRIR